MADTTLGGELTYLSLFSGIGGLDLGLDRAGWTCVGQVEKDEFCRRVLAKHWPEVPRHDDVRTAVEWWLGAARPAVDLVVGGFPCQPFSTAGRRQGVTDERWGWPWFADVVRAVRPRYILVENVAALLRDADAFGWLLSDLAAGGYDADWDCIPAAAVGAPHRRDRLFLVAHTQRDVVRDEPITEPGGGGSALVADDGPRRHVADADPQRRGGRPRMFRPVGWAEPADRGSHVADTDGEGRRPGCGLGTSPGPASQRSGRWAAEPDVGRVAHGVPARVDRLRALGNAVVPQVAEHVGRLIREHAEATALAAGAR